MKKIYMVEMFNTKSVFSVEKWEFNTKKEAKKFFQFCKNQYIEQKDKKHIEWILSKVDSDGDYWQLDNFAY